MLQNQTELTSLNAARLLDNLTTAVVLIDSHFNLLYINPAAQSLFKTSGSKLADLPINTIFNDDDYSFEDLKKAAETGNAYTKREATLTTPAKTTITVDYTVTPITLDLTLNTASQSTESRYLLVEIQHLDRLLRISRDESHINTHDATHSLIKGLAHEVKNPLGGIRGAAQLLEKEIQELNEPALEDYQDYLDVIVGETDRLRGLVDRILGPTQLPQIEATNIHFILERVKQIIDAESQGRVTIQRDYDTSIPELYADKDQLIQAFLNITRNALEALENERSTQDDCPNQKQKTITLQTRIDHNFTVGSHCYKLVLCVSIRDNGPGIPKQLEETLFFPMISGRADGTGLGLSIAQSLIRQHHGLIEVESKPNDTVFKIYLPLE